MTNDVSRETMQMMIDVLKEDLEEIIGKKEFFEYMLKDDDFNLIHGNICTDAQTANISIKSLCLGQMYVPAPYL